MTEAGRPAQRIGPWLAAAVALLAAVVALLTGCAAGPVRDQHPPNAGTAPEDPEADCRQLYRTVDRRVADAGVRDAQAARIRRFPYLRLDRFLAATELPDSDAAFEAWTDRLRQLDRDARRLELLNLVPPPPAGWPAALERCAKVLRALDLADPRRRAALRAARVPDAYRPGLRVLGLYPLTALPFLAGVANLHRDTAATFAAPLQALPVEGTLRRLVPAAADFLEPDQIADILARSAANPLALPDPDSADLDRLLATFAPVWEIDTATSADLPGHPVLDAAGGAQVLGRARVYTLKSFTRWQGSALLQLNYVLWFPARPRTGPMDLVGGHLDGITWRVTLGSDGRPLLHDAMHNCGCYYMAFPTPRLKPSQRRRGFEEPLAVPQSVPDGDGRLVLRIATGSHYLQRVYRDRRPGTTESYALAGYDELRSLARPGGGRRSLFRPDAIVAGTERRERWLFWPMGVPEPGAMRQWGSHAIAFVGRRHFDEPELFARYFVPAE